MAGNNTQPGTFTSEAREIFFKILGTYGTITHACEAAGVSRQCAYWHKKNDPEFAADWEDAIRAAGDVLEREAFRRSVEGVKEPVFYMGDVCGHTLRYSDSLLTMLLKGARKDKYGTTDVTVSGKPGGEAIRFEDLSHDEAQRRLTSLTSDPAVQAFLAGIAAGAGISGAAGGDIEAGEEE